MVALCPARQLPCQGLRTVSQSAPSSFCACSLSLPGANEEWWALLDLLRVTDDMPRMIWEVTNAWLSEGTESSRIPGVLQPLNWTAQKSLSAPKKLDCCSLILKGQNVDSGLLNTVLLAFQVSSSIISLCRWRKKNLKNKPEQRTESRVVVSEDTF